MVEDAHQVVVLVSGSSDLLALIHGGLLHLVAPLCPGRTLGQSVRNSRLAVPALVVETCLRALEVCAGGKDPALAAPEAQSPASSSVARPPAFAVRRRKSASSSSSVSPYPAQISSMEAFIPE